MFNTFFKTLLASSISSGTLIAIIAAPSQAIGITPENNPNVLINEIINGEVSFSVTSSSIASGATGIFTDGFSSGLDIDEGIILTSGQAADAVGPNGNGTEPEVSGVGNSAPEVQFGASTDNGFSGDSALDAIVFPFFTQDATVIEFTFDAPNPGMISFDYIFASEEYIDYENSQFNDVFGFFLNGNDIALVPGTNLPVDIDTINSFTNTSFFVQNISVPAPGDPAPFDLEYDGFTTVLTTVNGMVPAGTNTIKLAIADTSDGILDTAVFIEKGSFNFEPVPEPTAIVGLLTVSGLGAILKRKKAS